MEKEVDKVLLSFVIPVYNAAKTLKICLESILSQNTEDIEMVIINDGSTDTSQSIIDYYVAQYPSTIRGFEIENAGIGHARNVGIVNSIGKYIGFVDSDDYISNDYIESFKEIIGETDAELILINYHREYTRKRTLFEKLYTYTNWNTFNTNINLQSRPEIINMFEVAPWLRIVKRSFFQKNDHLLFPNLRAGEDLETSLKWYLYANDIYISNKKLYHYIIRSNTSNFSSSLVLNFEEVLKNVCEFYIQHEKFDEYYPELEHILTKHIIISNLFRLMIKRDAQKLEKFDSLRGSVLSYFPQYHKNRYTKKEPFYIRSVVYLTYKYPRLFRLILRVTI